MERAGRGNRWPTVSLETGWDSRTGVSGTDRNSDRGARPRSPVRGRPDEQAGRHQHGDRTAGRSVARPRFHWAGSGRPGMHLRRGFGAGLSAEQTCRALTVGPFLIFRHAPGEGRGPRVCPGGRSPGRVGGAGPRRVADHSAARPEKFSKNETVRTILHGPAPRGGPRRRDASDPAIAIGWPGRSAATSVDSSAPLTAFSKATAAGPARSRNPESPPRGPGPRVSADARAPPHQPSSQPYSH